jgi:hypothetical protein
MDAFDDGLDEDDINHFIVELQRIIHESPPGMQAKFARTISYLQSKKKAIIDDKSAFGLKKDEVIDSKQLLEQLLEIIDNYRSKPNSPEKFNKLMELTHLREKISQEKRQNTPEIKK